MMQFKKQYQTFICVFSLLLILVRCQKNESISNIPEPASNHAAPSGHLSGCDDPDAFKSPVDLQQLLPLQDCYISSATKEVPGLGAIPWKGNCMARIIQGQLHFYFSTYAPYFEELLPREDLFCGYVPASVGYHPVYDSYHYQQNPGTTFGFYSRLLDDGDVLDGAWDIDTSCLNFIEIKQLDLDCMEVRGDFELHLKMVQQGQVGILYSERINFVNGKLEARIMPY